MFAMLKQLFGMLASIFGALNKSTTALDNMVTGAVGNSRMALTDKAIEQIKHAEEVKKTGITDAEIHDAILTMMLKPGETLEQLKKDME